MSLTLTDWTARIFQHEFDHLQVCCCKGQGYRVDYNPR